MRRSCSSRGWIVFAAVGLNMILGGRLAWADTVRLERGFSGDGNMAIAGDQYGAFGSVEGRGYGRFDPDGPVRLRNWSWWSALMLTDGVRSQWLMDVDDWSGEFFHRRLADENLLSDTATDSVRTSRFGVPRYGDLQVDLVQETPASGYNFVQTYTFRNSGNEPLSLKAIWTADVDIAFAQDVFANLAGFVLGDEPRVYFIEESDVAGEGDPGTADRDRRISVAARTGGNMG